MCGRAKLPQDYSTIKNQLGLSDNAPAPNIRPSWNIPPTQDMLCVRRHPKTGERVATLMRWGLIPEWAKSERLEYPTFNARAETIDAKTTFRGAWKAGRRCLVVTDGFYEWRKGDKQPFAIARANKKLTVMAGLWEIWRSPADETIRSCTIITDLAWRSACGSACDRRRAESTSEALSCRGDDALAGRQARRQCEER